MKKLLYILLTVCLFTACSSDDDNNDQTQDYTSFTFIYHANVDYFPNCVAAYKKDNKYYKIADLGDLKKDISSKEITINDKSIKEVYLFTDYLSTIRFDAVYSLKDNTKNNFVISENTKGIEILDKTDQTQYPQ